MFNLDAFQGYPTVQKVWGREIILTNKSYCAKFMVLNAGFRCSLHRHLRKDETFFVLQGIIGVEWGTNPALMHIEYKGPGDPLPLLPGTYHRFWQASDDQAIMLEVSSHHDDADVERLEESGPFNGNQ